MSRSKTLFASLAALAALALGGSAIAGAVDNNNGSANQGGTQQQQQWRGHDGDGRGPHGPGMGETPLTGDTAAKVKAAAEAKVDGGTVIRTETDRGGAYEAHVRTKDGQEVIVKVDKSFNVTGTEQPGQHGPGGPHGPGMGETPLTGDTAAKVKAAAEAKVDGGTVIRTETDRGGAYEAHVRTKDGQEVIVKVDKSFNVTGTEQPGQHGAGGPQDQAGPQGAAYGAPGMSTRAS